MTDPIAYGVTYPGLKIIKADMVHTHGVTPSICYCTAIPEVPADDTHITDGTLTFTRNGAPFFSFKHCAIRAFYLQAPGPRNSLRAEVEIVDRRHLWSGRTVGGKYNTRTSTGEIDHDFSRSWEELFAIVLEALGEEEGTYILNLPDDGVESPAVEWNNVMAIDALAGLLERSGCVVSLSNDDHIIVEARGSGPTINLAPDAKMPVISFPMASGGGYVGDMSVEFAPTQYEMWIECEPAAFNVDGSIVALSEADFMNDYTAFRDSNAPGCMYGGAGVNSDSASTIGRNFIKQRDQLYRVYKIKSLVGGTLPEGGFIGSIEDVLPLLERNLFAVNFSGAIWSSGPLNAESRVSQSIIGDVFDMTPPCVIVGSYADYARWGISASTGYYLGEENDYPHIDIERGLLWFSRYIFRNTTTVRPGFVWIKATFNARDPDTGALRRHIYCPSGDMTAPRIKYNNAFLYYVETYDNRVQYLDTNKHLLDGELGPALSQRLSQTRLSGSHLEWNGLKNFSVRGNMFQMHWHVEPLRIYTRGSINFEHPLPAPGYSARERIRNG